MCILCKKIDFIEYIFIYYMFILLYYINASVEYIL